MSNVSQEEKVHRLFALYLDTALAEFELPHKKTDEERLQVYYDAFCKVVSPLVVEIDNLTEGTS